MMSRMFGRRASWPPSTGDEAARISSTQTHVSPFREGIDVSRERVSPDWCN